MEELSIRQLAEKHRVHRRTVRQAMESAQPPERKILVRPSRVLKDFKPAIEAMLRSDLEAPRKQRHAASRMLARLVDEHGADGRSYSTVRDYVARRRPEVWAEAGRNAAEGFVPQDHAPGAEGEVDFADLWVVLRGVKTKTALFVFRLSSSGQPVHRALGTRRRRTRAPRALRPRRETRQRATPKPPTNATFPAPSPATAVHI